jgi:hypothetical protein
VVCFPLKRFLCRKEVIQLKPKVRAVLTRGGVLSERLKWVLTLADKPALAAVSKLHLQPIYLSNRPLSECERGGK